MMNMRKLVVAFSLLGLASVPSAHAGAKWYYSAQVDTVGRTAWGDLATVRGTPDTVQRIGCYIYAYPTYSTALCYATNASNVSASCSTSDPTLIAAAQSLNGDSLIKFWWDASGVCTEIMVHPSSTFSPKQP